MMHVEENVYGFFRFNDPTAAHAPADQFEGIDQGVLDKAELKLRHLFHMDGLHQVRPVTLDQFAVIVVVKHGQQRRMVPDCLLQGGGKPLRFKDFLVQLHHGEKIVHCGGRRIQLVIEHVQLFPGQRMDFLQGLRVLRIRVGAAALGKGFLIQFRNFLRRTAAENLAG